MQHWSYLPSVGGVKSTGSVRVYLCVCCVCNVVRLTLTPSSLLVFPNVCVLEMHNLQKMHKYKNIVINSNSIIITQLRSCVSSVSGHWLSYGKGPFSIPPTESTSLNRSPKYCKDDFVHDQYLDFWCRFVHGGLVGKWVKYNKKYVYLFIYPFVGTNLRSDRSTDFFYI